MQRIVLPSSACVIANVQLGLGDTSVVGDYLVPLDFVSKPRHPAGRIAAYDCQHAA